MRVDKIHHAPHALGYRRGVQVQIMRPRYGHVRDRLVDLEKLEPPCGKLLAQDGRELKRKPLLVLQLLPHQPRQRWFPQRTTSDAAECVRFDRLDDDRLMRFAE